MSVASVSTSHRPEAPAATVWKVVLLAFPLVIATFFFFVWRAQVHRLANHPLESYGTVPLFELVNQQSKPYGSAQLSGKIWIADFIFTTCRGPCPIISSRMSELQKPLANTGVHLVSITVDPTHDTPEVLRDYAARLSALPGRWDFLTGPIKEIYDLSRNGFKLGISGGDDGAAMPVHSTRMVLVDRSGVIRGYYDALAPDGITRLLADTNHLLRQQPE